MIRQIVVTASIALLGISGQAMAAQSAKLGSVSGSVLVNQNGRFTPANETTTLRAGDRVLAMNGAAKLTYADGCAVTVAPRSMVTVSEAAIIHAMRQVWERMKIVIEPSAAVPVAAVLDKRIEVSGLRVGIVLSGGNVDLASLPF